MKFSSMICWHYEFIKQTHWLFIGSAGGAIEPQNEEHRQNLDKLHKILGYRFVLKDVTHAQNVSAGDELDMTIKVENKGVAPFYFDWPLALYLVDRDDIVVYQTDLYVDIIKWLPGNNQNDIKISLPNTISGGEYNVKIAIHDPNTDEPGVLFANTGKDDANRYLVGYLKIN